MDGMWWALGQSVCSTNIDGQVLSNRSPRCPRLLGYGAAP